MALRLQYHQQAKTKELVMNTLTTLLTATVLTLTTDSAVNAAELVGTDKSITTKLCLTAAKGNIAAMRFAIKHSRLSKNYIIENVQCNQQSFLSFVEQYGNNSERMNYLLTRNKSKFTDNSTKLAAR